MATYDQSAGSLNIRFHKADSLGVLLDFSIDTTGYTWDADIYSLVTSETIVSPTISDVDASVGQVNLDLTAAQSDALSVGTYGLRLTGTAPGSDVRRYIEGFFEVIA